ncbi:MAG: hypothetical protein EPO47_00060 [Rugosibacter sp.]|nr:MAG: hypothetical protein EPO60_10080 [Rugosibacter sp.]TBR12367.1 MAG: hypothetical protein EPO47_00060 [Rugosibacter sp.]
MRQQNKAQYCASAVHRVQAASIHTFYPDQDGVPNDLKFQGHGTTKSLAMIPGGLGAIAVPGLRIKS